MVAPVADVGRGVVAADAGPCRYVESTRSAYRLGGYCIGHGFKYITDQAVNHVCGDRFAQTDV